MRRTLIVAAVALSLAGTASAHRRYWDWGWYWGLWWGPWWGWGPAAAAPLPSDVAVVDTDVSPEDARVYLDGTLIGTADDFDGYPDYLYLEPGTYALEVRLPGYRSESVTIEAEGGRFFSIDNKLDRNPAEERPPWYERPEGLPTSWVFAKRSAAQREAKASGPDVSLRPELAGERGEEHRAVVRGAALDLRVEPPEASIYVDGEFVGTARELMRLERGLAVEEGHHTVEVFAPGHEPQKVDVEVERGESRQVVIELDVSDEAPPQPVGRPSGDR